MNNEQQELLDEVYENYRNAFIEGHIHEELDKCLSKEEFIEEIKTDSEFSEKWGLKIEERELSFEERQERCPVWTKDSYGMDGELRSPITIDWDKTPTKLITITYNDKTIESYE
jgi:hypothetical protein